MSDSASERTQEPTPRRRQLARQQGHVARSAELTTAVVCLSSVGSLLLLGPTVVRSGSELLQQHLSQVQLTTGAPEYHVHLLRQSVLKMAVMLGPWLVGLCATAYAVQVIQIGWLWLPRNVVPDPQRIAPGRAVQHWLDPAQLFRLLSLAFKLVCVLAAAGWLLREHLPTIQGLGRMSPADLLQVGGRLLLRISVWSSLLLLLWGLLDYAWQRWRYERELRIAPDDWHEDVKMVHNDIASLRRRRMRDGRTSLTMPPASGSPREPTDQTGWSQYP